MIQQGIGHIVNMASACGIVPYPLCCPYVASKFAVFGLTNALQWKPENLEFAWVSSVRGL